MTTDAELLRRYAQSRSEAAFAELVRRHVDMVYSSALRQMGGHHHQAQEVTQMVFTDLSRKAVALTRHPVLPAWLHRSCRLAALALRRREGRRRQYESAAGEGGAWNDPPTVQPAWDRVAPVLDEAINGLEAHDRQAIILRFFGNHPFGEIGLQLRVSENAARMRVERALDKLRRRLGREGITSTAAALAAALVGQSVGAAPAGVAVSSSAVAVATSGGGVALWFAFMTPAKLPFVLAAAVLVGGSSLVAYQDLKNHRDAEALGSLGQEEEIVPLLQRQNSRLAAASARAQALRSEDSNLKRLQQTVRELESARASSPTPPASPAGAVLDLGQLDRRPKPLTLARPQLPPGPHTESESAEVLVDFVVGADGTVRGAFAAQSTDRAFEASAVAAVSQWVFSPGQLGGQNVNTHMQVPIVYSPSGSAPPPPVTATWF